MSALLDTASWALILGILAPLLVSVVQQPQWTDRTRAIVSAAASVVIGLLTVLANGLPTGSGGDVWQEILSIIALVLVASNTAYKTLWKPTGVSPVIEMFTSRAYKGRHAREEDDRAA